MIVCGVQGVRTDNRAGRNTLFAACTRSKAWLRVSGTGAHAAQIIGEIEMARQKAPDLEFIMPDLSQIETIQRDLSSHAAAKKKAEEAYYNSLRESGVSDDLIEDMQANNEHSGTRASPPPVA